MPKKDFTIEYNKHIDRIGIEFEGLFSNDFIEDLSYHRPPFLLSVGSDSSIRSAYNMQTAEARTRPLFSEELIKAIKFFSEAQKKKSYRINSSCGLHYHVSIKKEAYPLIVNQEFFDNYRKMFSKNFPKVYKTRYNNHYCSATISKEKHFTIKEPPSRYKMVNYCLEKHGTVEFRAYGGKDAKVRELGELIKDTLALIGTTIDKGEGKYKPIKEKVELMTGKAKNKFIKIDLVKGEKPRRKSKKKADDGDTFFSDYSEMAQEWGSTTSSGEAYREVQREVLRRERSRRERLRREERNSRIS